MKKKKKSKPWPKNKAKQKEAIETDVENIEVMTIAGKIFTADINVSNVLMEQNERNRNCTNNWMKFWKMCWVTVTPA